MKNPEGVLRDTNILFASEERNSTTFAPFLPAPRQHLSDPELALILGAFHRLGGSEKSPAAIAISEASGVGLTTVRARLSSIESLDRALASEARGRFPTSFLKVAEALAQKREWPAGRRLFLALIAELEAAGLRFFKSRARIAEELDCSPKTITRHVTALEAEGWLLVTRGHRRTNTLSLTAAGRQLTGLEAPPSTSHADSPLALLSDDPDEPSTHHGCPPRSITDVPTPPPEKHRGCPPN